MSALKDVSDLLAFKIMALADELAQSPADAKKIDARAWRHLLIYAPKYELGYRLQRMEAAEEAAEEQEEDQ